MKSLRITNIAAINLTILLLIPSNLKACGFTNDYWSYGGLGAYLFLFFSFWIFISFLYQEITYCIRNRINFPKHVMKNQLVFWGVIPPILYLILRLLKGAIC